MSLYDTVGGRGYSYLSCRAYPTRDRTSHIFATWNRASDTTGESIYRMTRYVTTTPPDRISLNSTLDKDADNPFSDSMSYISKINMSGSLRDGELYETWIPDADNTVVFLVITMNSDVARFYAVACKQEWGDNRITNNYPSISYSNNQIKIGKCCSGERIVEFRRTDIPYGSSSGITDQDTLDEMLFTTCVNTEGNNPYWGYYDLYANPKLTRWARGNYTVGVNVYSSLNYSEFSSSIDLAINLINSVMQNYGVSFTRVSSQSGDITITLDAEDNLYPDRPSNYVYGGTWDTTVNSSGIIRGATIKYAVDYLDYAQFLPISVVVLEELVQCMGAGFDQVFMPYDTIHVEFNYYNKANRNGTPYIPQRDIDILNLVYSSYVNAGDSYYSVARKLNIPRGCYEIDYNDRDTEITFQASQILDKDAIYEIRVFVVNNDGQVSGTSPWITVDTSQTSNSSSYVYTNGSWKEATPYIFTNGRWMQCEAEVFSN